MSAATTGGVALPPRTHYIPAALPDLARQAGIQCVVHLKIVVDRDGTVMSAKVLRSIPLVDAVRQWRYTSMLLNGRPVPVVMTVIVQFQHAM